MNHYCKWLLFFSIVFLAGSSCKKETVPAVTGSLDYFPVEKGYWVEYEVDSIYHADNDNNNDDSVYSYHFQIRQEIDSSFNDLEGRPMHLLLRYKRYSNQEEWQLVSVRTISVNQSGAFTVEENRRFQKLAFPYSEEITWNGNAYNTSAEEIYHYEALHVPMSINNQLLDSTLTVIQVDENNYIERIYGKEIYATGIGLIYQQRDDLQKRNGIVVKGLEYRMVMNACGRQ